MNYFDNMSPSCSSLLAVGALCLLLGSTAACERRASTAARMEEPNEQAPAQESWDIRFNMMEGADPRLQMAAGHMAKYERGDSTYTLLRPAPDSADGRVTVQLFDEQGDSSATVTADRVLYFEADRRFVARGSVAVHTKAGKQLRSETLHWDEAEKQVRTPGFVQITTPKERIQGYELVGDENLKNYKLGRVTGQVTVDQ